MYNAIIWDLDGVLVDSLRLRIAALRNAASEASVVVPDEESLRRWLCHGPRFALRKIPGANTSLRDFEQFSRRAASQYLTGFAGISQILKSIDQKGVRQGLVTSRTASDTDRWLNLCHIPRVFHSRITYSDQLPSKPNPAGLLAIADLLQVDVRESAYIGDTIEDGIACKRARMAFLLAGWGTPDVNEVLAAVGPARVMNIPSDVLSCAGGGH